MPPSLLLSQRVTWSSSDASVVFVASDGTVTFKKAGTVTIIAKANSGSASASITATVTGETPKATNVIYATMPSGWSGTLYAYVYSGSGTAKNAAWPGAAMTKVDSSDDCANAGTYKYEVPDALASNAKAIRRWHRWWRDRGCCVGCVGVSVVPVVVGGWFAAPVGGGVAEQCVGQVGVVVELGPVGGDGGRRWPGDRREGRYGATVTAVSSTAGRCR